MLRVLQAARLSAIKAGTQAIEIPITVPFGTVPVETDILINARAKNLAAERELHLMIADRKILK